MGQNLDSLVAFVLLSMAYTEKQVIENIYSSKVIATKFTSGIYIILNEA